MPFPQNILELHAERLEADKLYVQGVIAAIELEIKNRVENELEYLFFFDTATLIGNLKWNQQSRIIDQVILYFRQKGIRASVTYSPTISYMEIATPVTIRIQWFIRSGNEYMKTFV